MSGGGGSGASTNTVQNTNAYIPPWLEGYSKDAVDRANALSLNAYQPYGGQTVAGIDPAQQQAYQQVQGVQGLGLGAAAGGINAQQALASQVTPLSAAGIQGNTDQLQQGFNQQVYGPSQGLLGNYTSQGPATAQGVAAGAQQLMSPYTQSVIDPANQLMQQQLAQNLHTIGAGANQAGAFGGSRQGVQEGIAQSQAALGSRSISATCSTTSGTKPPASAATWRCRRDSRASPPTPRWPTCYRVATGPIRSSALTS